jgi:transcriptional regulator with XRE-family HTH domain
VGLSPAAARRRLGTELRALRLAAGKKIEDAATKLECSTAKVSRLEHGKGVPYRRDVADLLELYKVDRSDLMELAEEGRAQDWFDEYKDVLPRELYPDHMQRFAALERDASVIKSFEPELIPGPLQSAEYTDAVLRIVLPQQEPEKRRKFVEFRQGRQKALLHGGRREELAFAVGELAVRRAVVDPAILRGQLETLVEELDGPLKAVDFRLIPLLAETPAVLGGPFTVLKFGDESDQDVVFLEGRDGATYLESDVDVRRYEEKFRSLQEVSPPRAESLKRLAELAERLG